MLDLVQVMYMTTGERIQKARKENGLTQKQLAEKIGSAVGTIQQYELGKRRPKPEQMQRIAEVLGTSTEELLGYVKRRVIIPGRLTIVEINDPELDNYQFKIEAEDEEAFEIGVGIIQNAGIPVFDYTPVARVLAALDVLNDKGQAIAVERIEELTKIADYRK